MLKWLFASPEDVYHFLICLFASQKQAFVKMVIFNLTNKKMVNIISGDVYHFANGYLHHKKMSTIHISIIIYPLNNTYKNRLLQKLDFCVFLNFRQKKIKKQAFWHTS